MRLKCIKLVGFKSFVDPTTVTFRSNLCAVVGPNGCGKSNIIDAVRWVMGESSAKNLRGEAMTDVIFNGSGGRKPVGQASIELVFDNTSGKITGEYAAYAEISVKRKVTREAQNFYYLNGAKCRRRDITDIFLGTGLGPRSYAIIEQGMISRLIEAKPDELRVYVEEAAGISKYKERRRDTENRMRRTQENLERLTDIREELGRQLQRLQRQSEAAEKFTGFKQEERQLKAQLQAWRFKSLADQKDLKSKEITEFELKVEAKVTERVHQDASMEKYREQHADLSDSFNEVQGRFYALGSDISRLEQGIQHAEARSRELTNDLDQTTRECVKADEHMASDIHKSEAWQVELLEIEPEMAITAESAEVSAGRLMESEDAMHVWQQEWDHFNARSAAPKQQAEVQQSRIQHLEQLQSRLLDRIQRLKQESSTFAIDESEAVINAREDNIAQLEKAVSDKQLAIGSLRDAIVNLRTKQEVLIENRDNFRSELQAQKGRSASLDALQQAALNNNSKEFETWKSAQGLTESEKLAESLQVDSGWETAVETVLGKSLQAVCADRKLAALAEGLQSLSAGDVTLLGNETVPNPNSAAAERLLDKVSSAVDLSSILHGVYIADDLAAALNRQGNLAHGESVVTRDGVWLGANWIRVARGDDTTSGMLARKQELTSLQAQIESNEAKLASVLEELALSREQLQESEQGLEQGLEDLALVTREQAEAKTQVGALKAKIEQVLQAKARVTREMQEADQQIVNESKNLSEARKLLEVALEGMEQDAEERESLLDKRETIRGHLNEAREKSRQDKDKSHELTLRVQSIKTQLESVKLGIVRLDEQKQSLYERRENLRVALAENSTPIDGHRQELESLLESRVRVERELADARRSMESVEQQLRESESIRHQVEQALGELRVKLEASRLEAQTLFVQADNLKQQLLSDGFEFNELISGLDSALGESELEEMLGRVNNRIARLGAINLAAIDEYKIESERKNYLDTQHEDLVEAQETLESAIKKIDKETRTRFKETFEQINNGLQELFPRVFGGGHANLELTGDDLLDAGVAIMARPPGKKNSSIHLLSGGEKALTAIALVFSIFRLNPAPFCMLDEVDAPLDDANVERYARMVKEISSDIQFIYITHNKIAMEMALQLMGVTMHEPGVSRMVTVDVDEAAELAAV